MRLFEEILSKAGDGGEVGFAGAKAVFLGGRCAALENVRGIYAFTEEEAVFLLARGRVRVAGKGLRIARYGDGDALIEGDVRAVEFEREERA